VAEHHDGFPMYDCSFTNWNAAQMGPCRNIVTELAKEVRRAGLKLGVSSHRAFNWHYYTFRDEYDTSNTESSKLYGLPHVDEAPVSYEFMLDWYARTKELIDKFHPDVLYFDFGWHRDEFKPWLPQITAYYYNHALEHGYKPALNYKDKFPDGIAVYDIERGKLDNIRKHYWQTDTSVSYESWGYIKNDKFKTVTTLVHDLVDIVSKNGNLLLNIGPRPDGIIPKEASNCLMGIGRWLKVNGEAIYNTRHWQSFGEGPTPVTSGHFAEKKDKAFTSKDIRFTVKGNALYAICLGWPGKETVIKSLSSSSPVNKEKISQITMLGSGQKLNWSQDRYGLRIKTPSKRPCKHAYTFKITFKNK
jgi:alpha-L-fucosidase